MENNDWILIRDAFPSSGVRCLVTDGNVIVFATYLLNAGEPTWLFSGLTDPNDKTFEVQAWTHLPKLPKTIISYEVILDEDKKPD